MFVLMREGKKTNFVLLSEKKRTAGKREKKSLLRKKNHILPPPEIKLSTPNNRKRKKLLTLHFYGNAVRSCSRTSQALRLHQNECTVHSLPSLYTVVTL